MLRNAPRVTLPHFAVLPATPSLQTSSPLNPNATNRHRDMGDRPYGSEREIKAVIENRLKVSESESFEQEISNSVIFTE